MSEAQISQTALREVHAWNRLELPNTESLERILDRAEEQAQIYFQRREYYLEQAQLAHGEEQDRYLGLAERCKDMQDKYREMQHMYAIRGFTKEPPQDSIIYCRTLKDVRETLDQTTMTVLFIYDFGSRQKYTPENIQCKQ